MVYLIISLVCSVFTAFFIQINLRYFALLPIFFLLFFFSQGFSDFKIKVTEWEIIEKYWLYVLLLLSSIGVVGILNFMGLDYQASFFVLLSMVGVGWMLSYFLNYPDGKVFFHQGFITLLILLLVNSVFQNGWESFSPILETLSLIAIVAYALLWYGVGAIREVGKEYVYYFYFALLFWVGFFIFSSLPTPLYGFNAVLLLLLVVMVSIDAAQMVPDKQQTEPKKISLRRILAWEKVLTQKSKKESSLRKRIFWIIKKRPSLIDYLLEYVNVGLLIGVLVTYLLPFFQGQPLQQRWYRSGIALFLANAFFIKKNKDFWLVTRFAVALIINFSLYISLLIFWGNAWQPMLPWLIARNILCWILIFYTKLESVRAYVKKIDIIFWLLTTMLAMLLNIVLLMELSISWQLIFSLIFFYVGVQGVIVYYALQIIQKYSQSSLESEENKKIDSLDPLAALIDKEMSL